MSLEDVARYGNRNNSGRAITSLASVSLTLATSFTRGCFLFDIDYTVSALRFRLNVRSVSLFRTGSSQDRDGFDTFGGASYPCCHTGSFLFECCWVLLSAGIIKLESNRNEMKTR